MNPNQADEISQFADDINLMKKCMTLASCLTQAGLPEVILTDIFDEVAQLYYEKEIYLQKEEAIRKLEEARLNHLQRLATSNILHHNQSATYQLSNSSIIIGGGSSSIAIGSSAIATGSSAIVAGSHNYVIGANYPVSPHHPDNWRRQYDT